MNVVDTLVLQFKLDPTGAVQGAKVVDQTFKKTKETATATGKDMERAGTNAAQFFGKVKNEVIGLTAAILGIGTISGFVKNLTKGDLATKLFAESIGLTAKELSIWHVMIQTVGGDAASIDGDFARLNERLQEWKTTGDLPIPLLQALSQLKIKTKDFLDTTKPITEQVRMLSAAYEVLDPRKRSTFGGMIGISSNLVNLIKGGPGKLQELHDKYEKFGMRPEDEKAAEDRNSLMVEFTNRIETAGRKIATSLNDPLKETLELVGKIVDKMPHAYDEARLWTADLMEKAGNFMKEKNNTPGWGAAWENFGRLGAALGIPQAMRKGINAVSDFGSYKSVRQLADEAIAASKHAQDYLPKRGGSSATTAPEQPQNPWFQYIDLMKRLDNTPARTQSNLKWFGGLSSAEQEAAVAKLRKDIAVVDGIRYGSGGNTSKTDVHIDSINIYPPNGDAKTIAGSIAPAIHQSGIIVHAGGGLQ